MFMFATFLLVTEYQLLHSLGPPLVNIFYDTCSHRLTWLENGLSSMFPENNMFQQHILPQNLNTCFCCYAVMICFLQQYFSEVFLNPCTKSHDIIMTVLMQPCLRVCRSQSLNSCVTCEEIALDFLNLLTLCAQMIKFSKFMGILC